ncbi:MAG: DUF6478 family protein [Pseudomonadota bacterium]
MTALASEAIVPQIGLRTKLTNSDEERIMGVIARRLQRLNARSRTNSGGRSNKASRALAVFNEPLLLPRAAQPASGSEICEDLTIYHDASDGVYYWQQTADSALQLTVYQFNGSYLSLAIRIDEALTTQMRQSGCVDVCMAISSSRPITAFLRLNVQVEGRCEQMHQTLIVDKGERSTHFDLDGLPGELGPIQNAWLDLIFSDPQMLEITLSSLILNDAMQAADAP